MRLYVCGPVTGMLDRNAEQFGAAGSGLEAGGHSAVVPIDVVPAGADYHDAMRECVSALLGCDGVALLPGWERSFGCGVEVHVARACGMSVMPWRDWIE